MEWKHLYLFSPRKTYLLLRGRMTVIFYNELGAESGRYLLDPREGNYGLQIPAGQWHGLEVLEPSAIIEIKDGPIKIDV